MTQQEMVETLLKVIASLEIVRSQIEIDIEQLFSIARNLQMQNVLTSMDLKNKTEQ